MEQPNKKTQKITKKRKNQYLTLEFKMNYITQLLLMVFPVPLAAGLGYQLDVVSGGAGASKLWSPGACELLVIKALVLLGAGEGLTVDVRVNH